jgi:hypothetical protein
MKSRGESFNGWNREENMLLKEEESTTVLPFSLPFLRAVFTPSFLPI